MARTTKKTPARKRSSGPKGNPKTASALLKRLEETPQFAAAMIPAQPYLGSNPRPWRTQGANVLTFMQSGWSSKRKESEKTGDFFDAWIKIRRCPKSGVWTLYFRADNAPAVEVARILYPGLASIAESAYEPAGNLDYAAMQGTWFAGQRL